MKLLIIRTYQEDITLPSISDNKIKCPNVECHALKEKITNIKYIKYDYDNIKTSLYLSVV